MKTVLLSFISFLSLFPLFVFGAFEPGNILKLLAPSPHDIPKEEYDGLEFRYGRVTFRPALFKREGLVLGGITLFFAISYLGRWWNTRIARNWLNAHIPLYTEQFSSPTSATDLVADGATDFFAFSTGRRHISSLHTTFSLVPRHDIFQMIADLVWSLVELEGGWKSDQVVLDFKMRSSGKENGFVWAVVLKDEMQKLRTERWDLTFTKTTDNTALPADLTTMTEAADITDSIFTNKDLKSITSLLRDPSVLKHFRSLIITDQPVNRPADGPLSTSEKERHVYLTLSNLTSKPSDTIALVKAIFDIVDVVEDGRITLKPETTRKLKKVRADLDEELTSEAKAPKTEEVDEKKLAKRKAEEERVSKMSPADQKKWEEKERKKAMRKAQSKMVKR